jgi:hypothetical protein
MAITESRAIGPTPGQPWQQQMQDQDKDQPWRDAASVRPALQLFSAALHLPFDVMRAQHAQAIQSGLMANSILESRDFEHRVDALEHLCLGPFARHV